MEQRRIAVRGSAIAEARVERDAIAVTVEREPAGIRIDGDHASTLAVDDSALEIVALRPETGRRASGFIWRGLR